jgi:hypothetical protein
MVRRSGRTTNSPNVGSKSLPTSSSSSGPEPEPSDHGSGSEQGDETGGSARASTPGSEDETSSHSNPTTTEYQLPSVTVLQEENQYFRQRADELLAEGRWGDPYYVAITHELHRKGIINCHHGRDWFTHPGDGQDHDWFGFPHTLLQQGRPHQHLVFQIPVNDNVDQRTVLPKFHSIDEATTSPLTISREFWLRIACLALRHVDLASVLRYAAGHPTLWSLEYHQVLLHVLRPATTATPAATLARAMQDALELAMATWHIEAHIIYRDAILPYSTPPSVIAQAIQPTTLTPAPTAAPAVVTVVQAAANVAPIQIINQKGVQSVSQTEIERFYAEAKRNETQTGLKVDIASLAPNLEFQKRVCQYFNGVSTETGGAKVTHVNELSLEQFKETLEGFTHVLHRHVASAREVLEKMDLFPPGTFKIGQDKAVYRLLGPVSELLLKCTASLKQQQEFQHMVVTTIQDKLLKACKRGEHTVKSIAADNAFVSSLWGLCQYQAKNMSAYLAPADASETPYDRYRAGMITHAQEVQDYLDMGKVYFSLHPASRTNAKRSSSTQSDKDERPAAKRSKSNPQSSQDSQTKSKTADKSEKLCYSCGKHAHSSGKCIFAQYHPDANKNPNVAFKDTAVGKKTRIAKASGNPELQARFDWDNKKVEVPEDVEAQFKALSTNKDKSNTKGKPIDSTVLLCGPCGPTVTDPITHNSSNCASCTLDAYEFSLMAVSATTESAKPRTRRYHSTLSRPLGTYGESAAEIMPRLMHDLTVEQS